MINVGILFLGRKRPGFDPEWGKTAEKKIIKYLKGVPFTVFRPDVSIVDDLSLQTAIRQCWENSVDALITIQPTLSDGNLSASLSRLWPYPPVLWALSMNGEGPDIKTNSLVGTHIHASTLAQLGSPFELLYGMPGDKDFDNRFNRAVRLVYSAKKIKIGRVGLIGYHSPGYINVQADAPSLKKNLGMQLHHFGIKDLTDAMDSLPSADVKKDVDKTLELGIPLQEVTAEDLDVASRYYLAMSSMITDENLDALAVRCWSELPNVTGQWPYLAFTRMLSEEIPVGCEGDVDGAISCLVGNLLGFGPGYLSDWLEHDHETITIWHTGNPTFQILQPVNSKYGPRIGRHFNNKKPAVVEGSLKIGEPITMFRLWRCCDSYHLTAFEGETIEPRRHLMGTNGLARIADKDPCDLFEQLCYAGMPHHIAIFQGLHKDTLIKFARLMGINWID